MNTATLTATEKRQELGQFLTPAPIARFMASLFRRKLRHVRLLDAGAGSGALTLAVVQRWCESGHKPQSITVTGYEIDPAIIPSLEETYAKCEAACLRAGIEFRAQLIQGDFVEAVLPSVRGDLFSASLAPFNIAILNPPYRKIQSNSATRLMLRSAGIEASNLYAGFIALGAKLLADAGEMVAITPRSFCNGPYFREFRRQFLSTMSLRRIHLFDSRSAAFHEDSVLQENVIVHATKSAGRPDTVIISSSSGSPDGLIVERSSPYSEIVSPGDPEQFVHLVTCDEQVQSRRSIRELSSSLRTLGLAVSTGKVVDFRARAFLQLEPGKSSFPLIYPCHFRNGFVEWPLANSRKPNAIQAADATDNLLLKKGVYVLVKRFSSKEEKRRIVACIYDPSRVRSEKVGFENHLNFFHVPGGTLSMTLAKGLAAYLNSTMVDSYFRQFNGHTQVNATDLRNLPYPTLDQLERIGRGITDRFPEQSALDKMMALVLA